MIIYGCIYIYIYIYIYKVTINVYLHNWDYTPGIHDASVWSPAPHTRSTSQKAWNTPLNVNVAEQAVRSSNFTSHYIDVKHSDSPMPFNIMVIQLNRHYEELHSIIMKYILHTYIVCESRYVDVLDRYFVALSDTFLKLTSDIYLLYRIVCSTE